MAPPADKEGKLAILEEKEGLTPARMSLKSPFPGNLDPDDLLAKAAGHRRTYVNAAFC